MRTAASVLLIGVVLFSGVLAWATVGELLRSTQDAVSSLQRVSGTAIPLAASPATPGALTTTPVAAASPVAASPVPSARQAGPPSAATLPPATEPPATARPAVETTSLTATPSPAPTDAPSQASPVPSPAGRSPWVLLPGPEPGSRVSSGPAVVEARGRGDAPIRDIRLELDGSSLPVTIEQRSESIWRAYASINLQPGSHQARAVVVDTEGRTGAYRWSFEAAR